MISARHAGDRGDLIYALPVIRYYGGGILYLETASYTRERLTWERWQSLVPLLKAQPYIKSVEPWVGDAVTLNLNDFRPNMIRGLAMRGSPYKSKSLASWIADTHKMPESELNNAWITVPEVNKVAKVVMARSSRYHNPLFNWGGMVQRYGKEAVFVGMPDEHRTFCHLFGQVPYYQTENFLELAKVVAGCDLFIGNQSCPYAICEGLKRPAILEVWADGPNCLFFRHDVIHGHHHGLYRPITET